MRKWAFKRFRFNKAYEERLLRLKSKCKCYGGDNEI